MSFESMMRRKDRPLPKRGCSVAFYIFMAVLLIFILVMYIIYRTQQ